ncbi:MAG: sigma-54 dependent transcriptional regulator [Spirochaetales bacterium]|nr:sigma-54 dependent transcriptional regulator [Spirochaetales bacterium]
MCSENKKILIVEDEERLLDMFILNFQDKYSVEGFLSAEDFFSNYIPDNTLMIITDVRLPGKSGLDILAAVKKSSPDVPIVVMTSYGSIDQAVSALKLGAYDYFTKPVSFDQIEEVIKRVSEYRKNLKNEAPHFSYDSGFITADEATINQLGIAARVAEQKIPVLIQGETGTGKEIVSEYIHKLSGRKGAFVKLNCAAIPAELLDGELFGYKKGAFTGALDSYAGKVKLADGGTLFLDEIGELPEPLQAKLLCVLEDESFYPLGDNKLVNVDLRVIAATNRNLKAEAEAGKFRSDLYYRLAVVPVRIPPLRDRTGDVTLIARSFFEKVVETGKTKAENIDDCVYDTFELYSWPGNVRELRNAVIQMSLLASGKVIGSELLPEGIMNETSSIQGIPSTYEEMKNIKKILKNETVAKVEKRFVISILTKCGWNISRAAESAGADRRYLQNLMKKYGIKRPD